MMKAMSVFVVVALGVAGPSVRAQDCLNVVESDGSNVAIQACQDGTIVFTHDDGETRTMSVRDIIRAVDENKLAIANLTADVASMKEDFVSNETATAMFITKNDVAAEIEEAAKNTLKKVQTDLLDSRDVQMADLDKRLKTVTTDLSDTDTEVDTLVSNVKKLVAAVNNVEKCADQGQIHSGDGECIALISVCKPPATPDNGNAEWSGSKAEVLQGKEVRFTCNEGHFMTGRASIHCTTKSTFDFDAPTCTKCGVDNCKLCDAPNAKKCKTCKVGFAFKDASQSSCESRGALYIFGGTWQGGATWEQLLEDGTEVGSFKNSKWKLMSPDMPLSANGKGAVTAVFDNKLYYGLGQGERNVVLGQNGDYNNWGTFANSPLADEHPTIWSFYGQYKGMLYVFGGLDTIDGKGNKDVVIAHKYDSAKDAWSSAPEMDRQRYRGCGANDETNGKLWVVGGGFSGKNTDTNSRLFVDIFDYSTETWSKGPNLPSYAFDCACVVIDGAVYVTGGMLSEEKRVLAGTYMLAKGASEWKRKADMLMGRAEFTASVWNGMMFVMGGHYYAMNGGGNTVEYYNPKTNEWKRAPTMNRVRGVASSVVGEII